MVIQGKTFAVPGFLILYTYVEIFEWLNFQKKLVSAILKQYFENGVRV